MSELNEQLKLAVTESEYINGQEKMFGWALTKYSHIPKVIISVIGLSAIGREHVTVVERCMGTCTSSQMVDMWGEWMWGEWMCHVLMWVGG